VTWRETWRETTLAIKLLLLRELKGWLGKSLQLPVTA
jgi:hypothetical protein